MPIGSPLLFAFIFAFVGVCCIVLWFKFQRPLPLAIGVFALLIAASFPLASFVIVTPEEKVERTLNRIAAALRYNDAPTVLSFFAESAHEARARAQQELASTHFTSCWIAKIHSIAIDEAKSPPEAQAALAVVVSVSESQYGEGMGRVQLILDLVNESDGQWRISGYRYTIE
jgi:hypothetical protein